MTGESRASESGRAATARPRARLEWMPSAGGVRIVNARGIPGTGELAVTIRGGAVVLLTSYHVLFSGAHEREPVWLLNGEERRRVATSLYGRLGTVGSNFVDCAVAAIDDQGSPLSADRLDSLEELDVAEAVLGGSVMKDGAGSGPTRGVIADVARRETAMIEGRPLPAANQVVVRAASSGAAFSTIGDSGAFVRDDGGRVVGMIWGRNPRGETLACHIAPVLQVLGIRLARQAPSRRS